MPEGDTWEAVGAAPCDFPLLGYEATPMSHQQFHPFPLADVIRYGVSLAQPDHLRVVRFAISPGVDGSTGRDPSSTAAYPTRAIAEPMPEQAIEMRDIGESNLSRNLGHGTVREFCQERECPLQPQLIHARGE